MSKYTPGPWTVDERHGCVWGVIAEDGTTTAYNCGTTSVSEYVAQPPDGYPADIGSNAHHNMRLISEAPEMLILIKRALDLARKYPGFRVEAFNPFYDLIERIEGKS